MADTSKSIAEAINEATVAAGGLPSGGSIVDCVRNYFKTADGAIPVELQGGNANISNAARAILSADNNGGGSDTISAENYEDLTFPVTEGTYCIHNEELYVANQDIATSEAWNSEHWDLVDNG